jgi:hypothetical protein
MKALRQKHNRKKVFIITAIILLLGAGGYTAYAASAELWPFQKSSDGTNHGVDYNPPTNEQKEAGDRTKDETINNAEQEQSNPPTAKPTGKQSVGVTITSANQNGSFLQIRTLIQALDSGTCTLTLQKGTAAAITKTSSVQPLANSTTCQGFNIKTSELAPGKWTIKLVFESSKYKGSTTGEVVIE